MLRLEWSVGDTAGDFFTPGFGLGTSEILVTRWEVILRKEPVILVIPRYARHGSQFEVRFGVAVGSLNLETMGATVNGSQLFQTSNRTAFLLGGWPQNAQVTSSRQSPLWKLFTSSLHKYSAWAARFWNWFESIQHLSRPSSALTVQWRAVGLVEHKGRLWALHWWLSEVNKICSPSRGMHAKQSVTNLIRHLYFRSNQASNNIWRAPSSSANPLSFNGEGYLFVEQFANEVDIPAPTISVILRPNDERDGLVLYAYDDSIDVSTACSLLTSKCQHCRP